jgi:hypothetical protein
MGILWIVRSWPGNRLADLEGDTNRPQVFILFIASCMFLATRLPGTQAILPTKRASFNLGC